MNQELLTIKPQEVWKNFRELTLIPRPSKHEERIIKYMKEWGEGLGLETIVDEVGNVIIKKPATQGMENRKGVVLQSHLDMVPQKNSDKIHDFVNDPITTMIDGDWVTADGTTLGSDNGMGVAAIMGVLESKTIKHGAVEALLTIDEETGMTGAFALKAGLLDGDILLNLDSEDEGELYIGCAGGIDTTATLKYKQKPVPKNSIALKIAVTGLKGGHSGVDIPLQRGNANKIMFRLLQQAAKNLKIRIAQVDGGSLRNAIPREAFTVITLAEKDSGKFDQILKEYESIITSELKDVEANLKISYKKTELPTSVMDKKTTSKFINAVIATPHGVERLSYSMPEIAETSTNLAIVTAKGGEIAVFNLTRSFVDAAKDSLTAKIESVWKLAGAKVVHSGEYPGWKPNFDSPILSAAKDIFAKKFGNVPEIKSIHAGLECGLFADAYPTWDMLSFGPTIRFPHSPDEKVNIETVDRFWIFLVELLENIPSK
jgi:dipeptidase D